MRRSPRSSGEHEAGAAVVDFVLVLLVLVPLVLGVIQVALVDHVRNTTVAAATEGARYAATVTGDPASGAARTRTQLSGAVSARFIRRITGRLTRVGGLPVTEVRVIVVVPPLGLWGPGVVLEVVGHGVHEVAP